MTTWLELAGMKGYYQSENIPVSLEGDGTLSVITWSQSVSPNHSVSIYTSLSFNGGNDWSEWKKADNGGKVPDITATLPLRNALLRYRAFVQTTEPLDLPLLKEIKLEFEPVLIFVNEGDTACRPEIWITMNENGDFKLTNLSNSSEVFEFKGLIANETVYVNNEKEYIQSDINTIYRYKNFNDHYLSLPAGVNLFRVNGSAKVQWRSQFKLI
ncbi:hypothetical protein [Paenibacillus sp. NPDC058174]|uniref:hypothetical protein n=1 Tax=Paenibacillus sp. NPDC058174 TaxID=3346366 RepID=UPI0036DB309C